MCVVARLEDIAIKVIRPGVNHVIAVKVQESRSFNPTKLVIIITKMMDQFFRLRLTILKPQNHNSLVHHPTNQIRF